MATHTLLYGGMEGGGTKFVCAVGSGPGDLCDEVRFPTTTPDKTLSQALDFFQKYPLTAIGLAPFGPLDLDPLSPDYGSITSTPKSGWSGTNIVNFFRHVYEIPLAFDIDVNAFGEYSWASANRNLESLVYFTIGTGIGAGIIVGGKIIHGLTHPEVGHMLIPHDRKTDPFSGICPFHVDCLEGLASGPALEARWGQPGISLPDEHPAWELEADYIATALVNTILTISPQHIILGGGVMQRQHLYPKIRTKVKDLLKGYLSSSIFSGDMDGFITPPFLGNRSGVIGALELAEKEYQKVLHNV
jgi:fructokinase